jgi:hypothetical protein
VVRRATGPQNCNGLFAAWLNDAEAKERCERGQEVG